MPTQSPNFTLSLVCALCIIHHLWSVYKNSIILNCVNRFFIFFSQNFNRPKFCGVSQWSWWQGLFCIKCFPVNFLNTSDVFFLTLALQFYKLIKLKDKFEKISLRTSTRLTMRKVGLSIYRVVEPWKQINKVLELASLNNKIFVKTIR